VVRAVDEGTGRGGTRGERLEMDTGRVLVVDHYYDYDDESIRADSVTLLSITRTTMSGGAAAETPRSIAVVPFLPKPRSTTSIASPFIRPCLDFLSLVASTQQHLDLSVCSRINPHNVPIFDTFDLPLLSTLQFQCIAADTHFYQ
jgi:hypothetical protein